MFSDHFRKVVLKKDLHKQLNGGTHGIRTHLATWIRAVDAKVFGHGALGSGTADTLVGWRELLHLGTAGAVENLRKLSSMGIPGSWKIGLIYGRYLQSIGSWNGHWFHDLSEKWPEELLKQWSSLAEKMRKTSILAGLKQRDCPSSNAYIINLNVTMNMTELFRLRKRWRRSVAEDRWISHKPAYTILSRSLSLSLSFSIAIFAHTHAHTHIYNIILPFWY